MAIYAKYDGIKGNVQADSFVFDPSPADDDVVVDGRIITAENPPAVRGEGRPGENFSLNFEEIKIEAAQRDVLTSTEAEASAQHELGHLLSARHDSGSAPGESFALNFTKVVWSSDAATAAEDLLILNDAETAGGNRHDRWIDLEPVYQGGKAGGGQEGADAVLDGFRPVPSDLDVI